MPTRSWRNNYARNCWSMRAQRPKSPSHCAVSRATITATTSSPPSWPITCVGMPRGCTLSISSWKSLYRRLSRGGNQGGLMIRLFAGAIGLSVLATSTLAADPIEIGIGYLHRGSVQPTLSLVEQPSENDGLAGARLAIEDNNTTGKFLKQ